MGYNMLWVELTATKNEKGENVMEHFYEQLTQFAYKVEYTPFIEGEPHSFSRKLYDNKVREDIRELDKDIFKQSKEEQEENHKVISEYYTKEHTYMKGFYFEYPKFNDDTLKTYLDKLFTYSEEYPGIEVKTVHESTSDDFFRWQLNCVAGKLISETWGYPHEYKHLEYTNGESNDYITYVNVDLETKEKTEEVVSIEEHNRRIEGKNKQFKEAVENTIGEEAAERVFKNEQNEEE